MALSNTELTSLLDGSSSGRFSASEFLNQITANNASANQATETGLKLLYDSGYSPSEAASLWNDAFGTSFTPEDYTTSLNNYGIEKVAKPQIAVFGDSISSSVGYALDGKGGGYSDTTYGNNLAQYLGQSLKVNAANNSMGGTTSSDSLTGTGVPYAGSSLPIEYGNFANYITENKPETAVLRFGAADAIRLNNADTTLKNIEEMVKVSEANGTKPILVGVTPFAKMGDFNAGNIDAGITDSMIASADAINKGIQDLASKYGVQFIDVRQVPVTQGALLDGVHPSGEYGAALNNYIANEIKDAGVFKPAAKAAEPTAMSVAPETIAVASTKELTSGLLSPTTQAVQATQTIQSPTSQVQDWPTINYGTYGTDGEVLTRTTTSDGTPFYLHDTDEGGYYQNPNTVESYAPFTGADGKTYYNVYAPVFSSGKQWNETPVTKVMTEAEFRAFQGGSTLGDALVNMANSPVGKFATAALGGPLGEAFGLTGSTAQAAGTGLIRGSTALAGGANIEDALKTGLLSAGLVYGGSELGKAFNTAGAVVSGDASDIAMSMADSGATLSEIQTALTNSGFSADVVADSLKDAANVLNSTSSTITSIPSSVSSAVDAVNVVGQSVAPSLSNLISTIATTPITTPTQVTAPVTTVNVEAAKTPEQVDQRVLDLVNSQIASNVTTPSNLANVQVSAQKPTTIQDVVNTITSVIPTITPSAAQTIAQQVITSNRPITTQDVINAVATTIPTATTPVTTPTAVTPEQVITSNKPATVQDIVTALTSTIPITNAQATYVAEQVISSNKPVTTQDVIKAITTVIPTVTPTPTAITTTPEVKVTAPKTTTTQDIINAITTVVPTAVTPPVVPTTTITAQKPSSITDAVTAATIPLIQPTTPLTVAEVKAQQDLTNSEKIRLAQLALTTAGLLGAGAVANSGGPTQYDVVPVPTDWTSPQTIAQTWNYPRPIDFGNRNLLMGTQWEKFLDPNYGRVPEPVKFSQPSNLSYTDLMGILGSKSGMPSSSGLSINDIVSGIQNQYGQVPSRTMG
jgi:lysophospholipase L1-like esterase